MALGEIMKGYEFNDVEKTTDIVIPGGSFSFVSLKSEQNASDKNEKVFTSGFE